MSKIERSKEELLSAMVLMKTPPQELLEALEDGLSRQLTNQKKIFGYRGLPRLSKPHEVSHDLKIIAESKTYIEGIPEDGSESGGELTYDRIEEN